MFAFEDGLHSVHHGMDQAQASSCPVAAAGAHLNATPVDGVAPCDVILPVVALAVETSPSDPIAHLASPEQGALLRARSSSRTVTAAAPRTGVSSRAPGLGPADLGFTTWRDTRISC